MNDAPATPPPRGGACRRHRHAFASGTYGGSFVPLKLAQRAAPDTPAGFEFVVSFGIGAVAVTAVLGALPGDWRRAARVARPSLHVHDGVMIVPGAVAGLVWSAGNMASFWPSPTSQASLLRCQGA